MASAMLYPFSAEKLFLIRDSETPAGVSESPFHRWGREGQQHLQHRFLPKRGAVGSVPSREKAALENPQIFQSCKHKNILSAIYAQSKRGAHSKSFSSIIYNAQSPRGCVPRGLCYAVTEK